MRSSRLLTQEVLSSCTVCWNIIENYFILTTRIMCHSRQSSFLWPCIVVMLLLWHLDCFLGNRYDGANKGLVAIPSDIPSDVNEVALKENAITEIGNDSLNGLSKLEVLYIGNNQLTSIHPEAFCGTVLRIAGLNNNNLSTVPDFLCLGNTLETVFLGSNRIQAIGTSDFAGLNVLRELYISKNLIQEVEGLDINLGSSLQILNMQVNFLDNLNITWSHFSALRVINLRNNRLQHITTAGMNVSIVTLEKLLLAGNNMTCVDLVGDYKHLFHRLYRCVIDKIQGNEDVCIIKSNTSNSIVNHILCAFLPLLNTSEVGTLEVCE